jgi:hypothetical protein
MLVFASGAWAADQGPEQLSNLAQYQELQLSGTWATDAGVDNAMALAQPPAVHRKYVPLAVAELDHRPGFAPLQTFWICDISRMQAASVAGTMWAGTDSQGDYYEFHFQPDGALHYKSPSGPDPLITSQKRSKRLVVNNQAIAPIAHPAVSFRVDGIGDQLH